MSKQDRQGVRRAADLEQKYSLGDIEESRKRSIGADSRTTQMAQQLEQFMTSTNRAIVELRNRIEAFYPVGSIYISTNSTSPATLLGGTWTRIEDCFLLAAGSKYAAGMTGGEAEHKLTIDEMPKHSHKAKTIECAAGEGTSFSGLAPTGTATDGLIAVSGGDTAHNNMPPYLAVYVWKRTA